MSNLRRFLFILALTAMWSPSFLFIKLALVSFGPLTIAALRVTIATLVLAAILYAKGGQLPRTVGFWAQAAVMGSFASVAPFALFSYAEQTIDSALAAIINGSSPMFTAILALAFFPSDRLTLQKFFGIFLSAMGLVFLFAPNITDGLNGTLTGIIAASAASISYSISHIWGKKYMGNLKPFVAPTAQLAMASLILMPLALLLEEPYKGFAPTANAIWGVLGLACFGTICAFILYYKLLEHCGPTAISTVACFFPVGGMVLGYLFLDESFSWQHLMAAAMILTGVVTVNELLPKKKIASQQP